MVSETFLLINDYDLTVSDAETVAAFLVLAAGERDVTAVADWFRSHIVRP